MLYLQLPPTEGTLARELKEKLLERMYEQHEGLLHAAEALKIPKARVMADLKVDKEFSVAVTQARDTLAEYLYEEAVLEADKATGREDTPACALRYKARIEAAQALERLRVPNKSGQGSHLHLHQGNIYISPERREALQAQRERLLGPNESLTSGLPNERLTRGTTSVEDISSDERKIERKSATDPGTPGEGGSP